MGLDFGSSVLLLRSSAIRGGSSRMSFRMRISTGAKAVCLGFHCGFSGTRPEFQGESFTVQ